LLPLLVLVYVKRMPRPTRAPRASALHGLPAWTRRLQGSGLLAQGARYALTGGTVTIVYLGSTTVLADVMGLPFQIALAIGACIGVSVHFTLQRFFVWAHRDEYALPLRHQAARYLVFAGAQYGLTAISTAILPAALGLPVFLVYFGTVAILVSLNFLVFRNMIFHPKL
jgi:putative flippase GtrA